MQDNQEVEKSKVHITVEIIEYLQDAVVIKTILKKTTGTISLMSVDKGQELSERTSPFDTFVQIIDGSANIVVRGITHVLQTGESMVIASHEPYLVKPNGRFKMVMTIIKCGYETV